MCENVGFWIAFAICLIPYTLILLVLTRRTLKFRLPKKPR